MSQLLRYLFVGCVNTAVGYLIIIGLMVGLKFEPLLSNAFGYGVCLVLSFVLNKKFTFRSSENFKKEVIPFLLTFFLAYIANLGTVYVFIYVLDSIKWIAQILGGGVYVFTSFLLNKYFVFRSNKCGVAA